MSAAATTFSRLHPCFCEKRMKARMPFPFCQGQSLACRERLDRARWGAVPPDQYAGE